VSDEKTYVTLGDIADELRMMKAQGMTREAVLYALDRVFWERDFKADADTKGVDK